MQAEIEELRKQEYQGGVGGECGNAMQRLVAAEVSKLFMKERDSLLEQLQDPAFRKWLHENGSFICQHGDPVRIGSKWKRVHGVLDDDHQVLNTKLAAALQHKQHATFTSKQLDSFGESNLKRNSYIMAGAETWKPVAAPVVQPSFPLASVFAFFNATVAADFQAGESEMDAQDIITQLICATEAISRQKEAEGIMSCHGRKTQDAHYGKTLTEVREANDDMKATAADTSLPEEAAPAPHPGAFAGKLYVTVEKIANFSDKAGFMDRADPFVKLTLGNETKRTSVKKNAGGDVIYRETFTFIKAHMLGELKVVVMDWDATAIGVHSNTLGECTINLHQMSMDQKFESKESTPFKVQIFDHCYERKRDVVGVSISRYSALGEFPGACSQ